jgi:hypothetical protein
MSGTWQTLTNAPSFAASTMLLLTDGTVMCQQFGQRYWWRLKPSPSGDYVNGTWSPLAPMNNDPLYYASAVLADGRVFVAGGELDNFVADTDLLKAQIYDPLSDAWSDIPTPAGWTNIGDAPCCVLADGRLLLGEIASSVPGAIANATALYDPRTNTWLAAGVGRVPPANGGVPTSGTTPKDDSSSEETWTLLPDGTVLTVECNKHPKAEKYLPDQDRWISAGSTASAGVDLVDAPSIEIGPALLMYDGRVFGIGASGHTALYTPPTKMTDPGTWTKGPNFPTDVSVSLMQAKDAPACLMPNGRVLCCAGPAAKNAADYPGPTHFFEFDGSVLQAVANPSNSSDAPFTGRMLLLPTGDVLFSNGSQQITIYVSDKTVVAAPAPGNISCPATVTAGQAFTVAGSGLNGASQAVSYGDDATMATNYPLVRVVYSNALTDSNDPSRTFDRVCYWRTFNHSTMGVLSTAAGSTSCQVPLSAPRGPAQLFVVANGVASAAVSITVQ